MKKVFLSITLFFTFAAYVLYVRIIGASAPVVLTPEPNKTKVALNLPKYNNSSTPNPTPKPTTTPSTGSGQTTPKPTPAPTPISTPPPVVNTGKYRNGSYTGTVADAYYGNVQVKAVISGGKITDVQFLDHPQGRQTSVRINARAMPYLTSEAIALQDANVDTVSGASFTSAAFRESLTSALAQAII
ncbi:MAG: FMN-binding protein [Candidatus Paceibacterota bacterium]|jgi:uncharacterized protein with FMN-binding domain